MINVVTAHRPPLVFEEAGTTGNVTHPLFTGYLVDLLPVLLQVSGIQEPYTIYGFNGSGGALLHNGSWSGIMGQLTSGAADLALFPLTLTAQRAAAIQHTTAYMDDGYGILVHIREIDPGYSFLMPFSARTWLCFLAALFGVVLMLTILDGMTRRARFKAIERTYGPHKVQARRRRDKLMGHAIETIMMSVGSGAAPQTRSWSVKIMFIAWAIFSVIMLSAYTANLTAHLTVNQIGVPIRSLSDLADTPQSFGVPADSSVSSYFTNSSDQGARSLRHKMVEYPSTVAGAAAVRDGSIAAFVCDYPVAQFFTQEPPCVLALGSETIGSGSLVLGLAPNSTLVEPLNRGLLQLSEAGYLAELRRKWFVEASQCSGQQDSSGDASGNGRLSMTQAWSVFTILAAGMGLSIIAAGLEMLYYTKLFKGVNQLKEDVSRLGPRATLKKRCSGSKAVRFTEAQLAGIVIPDLADDPDAAAISNLRRCSPGIAAPPAGSKHQRINGLPHKVPPPARGGAGLGGTGRGGAETPEGSLGRVSPPHCKDASLLDLRSSSELSLLQGSPGLMHHRAPQQQQQQHGPSPFQGAQAMPVSLFARASCAAAAAASSIRAGIDQRILEPSTHSHSMRDLESQHSHTSDDYETSEEDP